MADVIFIQILRAYLARVPDDSGGFLGALRDPRTAAALGVMHHRAEAPWTVASLAKEVGLSRSVFASRFTQLVGEPPLGYLTRLRMQKAATLLRDGAGLAEASRLTGYASEASFSQAFRQWAGVAPGAYRKQLRESPRGAD
jgi:AraC-like DNA-binding protein